MPHALVLNHTGSEYHYGCYGTCAALCALLREDGYTVRTVSVDAVAAIRPFPETIADLDNPVFLRTWVDANPAMCDTIRQTDLVVVNGEGTLHGFSHRPRNVLYLIYVAREVLSKPTFVVNHSLFPTDFASQSNPGTEGFYRKCLHIADGVAARDRRSRSVYTAMSIDCVQAFDLLPLYAARAGIRRPETTEADSKGVVLGVGIRMGPDHASALGRAVRRSIPTLFPLTLLNGAPEREPPQEVAYALLLETEVPGLRVVFPADRARNPHDAEAKLWLQTIAEAHLLVTGRYHHVVAALALGTPVVGITSNTDKIESSLATAGVTGGSVIDPADPCFEERLTEAIANALSGGNAAARTTACQQAQLLELAYANRIWPSSGNL